MFFYLFYEREIIFAVTFRVWPLHCVCCLYWLSVFLGTEMSTFCHKKVNALNLQTPVCKNQQSKSTKSPLWFWPWSILWKTAALNQFQHFFLSISWKKFPMLHCCRVWHVWVERSLVLSLSHPFNAVTHLTSIRQLWTRILSEKEKKH